MASAPHPDERPDAAPPAGGVPFAEAAPSALSLPLGVLHVFRVELDLPPDDVARLETLLSPAELAQARRFHFPRDGRRFTVRRAQLRRLLARYVGGTAASIAFVSGPQGKPALAASQGAPRLRFNLSRSDRLALIAVGADHELGVDLERVRSLPDALPVARRFFSEEERRHIESLPLPRRDAAFFSYWTRKEAVIKATGLGLRQPLDAFTLAAPGTSGPERVVVDGETPTPLWILPVPPPEDDFAAAIATVGAPLSLRCFRWPAPS